MASEVSRFRLNGRLVDPSVNRVTIRGETVQVEPKIMQVLVVLAEHGGDVVSRDELMARVWSGVFVTDDALNRAIRELRRLFDDDPDQPRVIETIRKRGYRLIAPVDRIGSNRAQAAASTTTDRTPGAVWIAAAIVAAMAAGAALAWFGVGRRALRTEARMRFVPLTTTPGNEVDPALSPSGRLAFVARAGDGRPHIFVKWQPDRNAVQITHGDAREVAPTWSPDDRQIAFARVTGGPGAGCDIWITDTDARAERRIGRCGTRDALRMSWSPDGACLAIASGAGSAASPLHLELLTVATGARRTVTDPPAGQVGDESPAFSPDGRQLAFVRSITGSIGDIFVIAIDDGTGTARRITFDNADVLGVDWEPDGQHLVFSSDRGGGISLWRVAVAGDEPVMLAGGGAKLKHPSVARHAGAIAYEDWHYEINIVELPTASAGATAVGVPISPTSDQWNFHPQISPDGSRVAFQSTRSGQYELWVADRNGSNARQLTHSQGYKSVPRWSPDGRRVVFSQRTRTSAEAIVIDCDSLATRSIARDDTAIVAPSWSHNGRSVYFGSRRSGGWQIWRVEADGGQPQAITAEGGYAATESVDGHWLYYTSLNRRGLWRRPIDGGHDTLVTDAVQADDWPDFGVLDRGIFFITRPDDGDPQLALLDLDATRPRLVTRLPEFAWNGLSVSSDGARVLYAHADRRESNITSLEFPAVQAGAAPSRSRPADR